MKLWKAILALLVAQATFGSALAQTYPSNPVHVIVGTAPGGAVDIVGRFAMMKLGESVRASFVVDNIPGPYTGLQRLQEATPDGYTLMLASSTMTVTKALFPALKFDPLRVTPVAQLADSSLIMVTRKGLAKSVADVVKLAKASPGKLSYASAGYGSPPNIAGELFKHVTGTDILHVPYKGVSPALADVLSGRIDLMFTSYASVLPFLGSGRLDAIAVTTAERAVQTPQLPTLVELGYKDMVTSTWVGLIAPYGTPPEIVNLLNEHLRKVLQSPANVRDLLNHGFEARTGTPEQFGALIRAEAAKNTQIVQRAGIKAN